MTRRATCISAIDSGIRLGELGKYTYKSTYTPIFLPPDSDVAATFSNALLFHVQQVQTLTLAHRHTKTKMLRTSLSGARKGSIERGAGALVNLRKLRFGLDRAQKRIPIFQHYTLSHPENDRDVIERVQEYRMQDASFIASVFLF